jgi:hypothetical protein
VVRGCWGQGLQVDVRVGAGVGVGVGAGVGAGTGSGTGVGAGWLFFGGGGEVWQAVACWLTALLMSLHQAHRHGSVFLLYAARVDKCPQKGRPNSP